MAKLPSSFDWKKSFNHIWLLGQYVKPRKVKLYDDDQAQYTLKESLSDAIDRFIKEGMLTNCELSETLYCVMTIADLKTIAKEEGFKLNGTKTDLIDRFLVANHSRAEQLSSKVKVLKCSQSAQDFLEKYEQEKNSDMKLAKAKSFEAFLESDSKKAYKIFVSYQRKYRSDFEASTYDLEKIDFIITSSPKSLGNINQADLISLRAATCMDEMWHDESAESWLPETFISPLKSNQIAVNYLKCNAEMRREIADGSDDFSNKKFRLVFDEYDVDSCSLCLRFKDKIFEAKDFPELPVENCTSEKGCQCRIYDVYNEYDDKEEDSESQNESSETNEIGRAEEEEKIHNYIMKVVSSRKDEFNEPYVLEKLKSLKKFFDDNLITEEEFKQKRAEIIQKYF
jgi:hypothetical protein